jgi:hypothetical protein
VLGRLVGAAVHGQPRPEAEVGERQRVVGRVGANRGGVHVRPVAHPRLDRVDVALAALHHAREVLGRDATGRDHRAELVTGARGLGGPDEQTVLVDPDGVGDVDHVVEVGDLVLGVEQARVRRVGRLDPRP